MAAYVWPNWPPSFATGDTWTAGGMTFQWDGEKLEAITNLPDDAQALENFALLMQSLQASIANTGWFPAVGSFEAGGVVTSYNQYLLLVNPAGGNAAGGYSWGGTLPKVVAPGSNPSTAGGTPMDGTGWVYRGSATLAGSLAAVAFSGDYNDLLNKPTGVTLAAVPVGNGGTISLGKVNSFSGNATATVPLANTVAANVYTEVYVPDSVAPCTITLNCSGGDLFFNGVVYDAQLVLSFSKGGAIRFTSNGITNLVL